MTTHNNTDRFVDEVLSEMVRGAVMFCESKNIDFRANIDVLYPEFKSQAKVAISEMLDDCKEAHDAGMFHVMTATAIAILRSHGIIAVKNALRVN